MIFPCGNIFFLDIKDGSQPSGIQWDDPAGQILSKQFLKHMESAVIELQELFLRQSGAGRTGKLHFQMSCRISGIRERQVQFFGLCEILRLIFEQII